MQQKKVVFGKVSDLRKKYKGKEIFPFYPELGAYIVCGKKGAKGYTRLQSYSYITSIVRRALSQCMETNYYNCVTCHTDGVYFVTKSIGGSALSPSSVTSASSLWREKESIQGHFMQFIGSGAGTWYVTDINRDGKEVILCEKRTGVPRATEWSDIKKGKVNTRIRVGAGRKIVKSESAIEPTLTPYVNELSSCDTAYM